MSATASLPFTHLERSRASTGNGQKLWTGGPTASRKAPLSMQTGGFPTELFALLLRVVLDDLAQRVDLVVDVLLDDLVEVDLVVAATRCEHDDRGHDCGEEQDRDQRQQVAGHLRTAAPARCGGGAPARRGRAARRPALRPGGRAGGGWGRGSAARDA